MQNPIRELQQIKEQLRQKSRDLQKKDNEISQLTGKLQNILTMNQQKMNEMQGVLNQKDEELKQAQQEAWAARMAKHVGIEEKKEEAPQPVFVSQEMEEREKKFQEELEALKKKNQDLMQRVLKEAQEGDKLVKEKSLLIRELKRVRAEHEDGGKWREEATRLEKELAKVKSQGGGNNVDYKRLLQEKEEVIQSYEKMLYGNISPDQEGMLPQEIIHDLRLEIESLEEDRKKMIIEIEQLQDANNALELKVAMSGEKESSDKLEHTMMAGQDSRMAQSAEFATGLERFLVSYADMVTLLLSLFVLLYSFSKIDTNKLSAALSSFQEKIVRVDTTNVQLNMAEVKMLERVRELVKDNVDPESLVRSDIKTILIRLSSSDLFSPGSSELIEGAEDLIIREMTGKIDQGVKQVYVDGHTDDVPIKSDKFPSNWELSSARASRVARVMIEIMKLPADRLVVAGYGEFRPLKPNNSDQNRAVNRRVEIKILKDKEVDKEEKEKNKPKEGKKTASAPSTGESIRLN